MKWDRLLEWMTHIGSGPWSAFRNAVDELDGSSPGEEGDRLYRGLRVALSDLGHADFFVQGSRRWHVRRPALAVLVGNSTSHLLIGGRTVSLTGSIVEAAEAIGAVVRMGESVPDLSEVRIDGDPAGLQRVAEKLGLQYLPSAAAGLAARLPLLRHTLKAAALAEEPINRAVRSWCFRAAAWVPERLDRTVREYSSRHGVRRYLVGVDRRHTFREIDKRAALYCAALVKNERIVDYTYGDRTVRVPIWAPLPEEHARIACLATGSLASVEAGKFVFKNLDPRIAAALLVSLGQGFPMPEASP